MSTISIAISQTSQGPVQIHLHLVATLDVTMEEARRLVNRRVVAELGTGLIARDPELTLNGEIMAWRVPIIMSLPRLGDVDHVGTVDVDARSGDILSSEATLQKIVQHTQALYTRATLPVPHLPQSSEGARWLLDRVGRIRPNCCGDLACVTSLTSISDDPSQ